MHPPGSRGAPTPAPIEAPGADVAPAAQAANCAACCCNWARLHAASEQFAVALAQARAQPIDVPGMASLVMAHEALRTAWASALADAVPPDAVPSAERLQSRWMRLLHQSLPLRTAFNDAAQAYNQAIAQFPAAVVARLFGFRPAGTVTRLAEGR